MTATSKYVRTELSKGDITLIVESCDGWEDDQVMIRGETTGKAVMRKRDIQDLIDLLSEYREGKI